MIILEYLSFDDSLSVSTTCKALRAPTEPFLYHEISWDWVTPSLRRVLRLLRTIINRLGLLSSVRHVSLLSSVFPWSQHQSGRSLDWDGPWIAPQHVISWVQERSLFKDVVQKGIDVIHRAEFPDAEEWIQALNDGNAYALAAILSFSNFRH